MLMFIRAFSINIWTVFRVFTLHADFSRGNKCVRLHLLNNKPDVDTIVNIGKVNKTIHLVIDLYK